MLVEVAHGRVTVCTGRALSCPVSSVRLVLARSGTQISRGILWVIPSAADTDSPQLDALILRLHRAGAAAILLPLSGVPESVRLLADSLGFNVLKATPEEIEGVLYDWWKVLALKELAEREQVEKVEDALRAAWATSASTEEFLAASGRILDARLRFSGEILSEFGEGPAPGRQVHLTERIVWGRGLGSTLEVEVPEGRALVMHRILPRLTDLVAVLADREAAEIESDLRLRGELLLELLIEHAAPTGSVLRAAERYGIDLGADHLVILLDLDDFTQVVRQGLLSERRILRLKRDLTETLEQEGRALFGKVWVLPHSDEFVLVVTARAADWTPMQALQAVRSLQQKVVALLRPYRVEGITAGLGFSYSGAQGLRKSFAEAHEALLVGRAQFGGRSVTHFKDLGLHRFLFGWFDSPRAESLAYEFIHPLLDDDPSQRAHLLPTLRAYLGARGRMTQAAKVLGIHRNSLRYRLDRIAQLLGLDLNDADVQLVLQLVVRTLPEDLGNVHKKSP